jgi:hypothetical protein
VPIEMASAGMLTVTNTFENKTADALAALAANLVAAAPDLDSVTDAIVRATAAAADVERRVAGSRVDWPRNWDEAFSDRLLERVEGLLGVRARP